jgi:pyruvate dehydrogenase E2 component (dihydrolipoamide acetyltransferase)
MPQLGMTMTEGSVVEWLKKPGEVVEKGELLFIVQTDKVDAEVEAPFAGALRQILVEPGRVVPVGTVIGIIAGQEDFDDSVINQPLTEPAKSVSLVVPSETYLPSAPTDARSKRIASPRAKKLARELGVEVSQVPDYKRRGRIAEEDVQHFHEETLAAQLTPASVPEEAASSGYLAKEAPSPTRRAIAAKMTASFRDVPHFYLDALADATDLSELRQTLQQDIKGETGVHLTYSDLFLKTLALALRQNPSINVYWQDEGIVRRASIHLGLAIQAAERLIVPVVRHVDELSLVDLARVRSGLVARARAGKLVPADLEDASCTLSNLGPQGVDHFHAIINPPQSAILAVGSIKARPLALDGAVQARQTVYLSLSVDHRAIDGTAAAAFLSSIVRMIESPYALLSA